MAFLKEVTKMRFPPLSKIPKPTRRAVFAVLDRLGKKHGLQAVATVARAYAVGLKQRTERLEAISRLEVELRQMKEKASQ